MHSIRPFFFVLGLVVASVAANHTLPEVSEKVNNSNVVNDSNGNSTITTTVTPFTTNYQTNTFTMTSISSTASTMNITKTNSTVTPPITKQNSSQDDKATQSTRSAMSETTPKPYPSTIPQERTSNRAATATMPKAAAGDKAGIIILVVILLIALGFGVACYFARKRDRQRYSVDLTSRPDEAHIPLSTMDPEMPVNTGPQNGLQTFVDTETTKNEPQEPEAKPEVQEEQKPEADKSVVDPSAESAAPAPSPDSPEDKPKEDAAEQSPPAPVKPSVEEKTDDEGVVSTKTSIESLKEINENNSNNADVSQKRDLTSSNLFWDIPLDCPV